MSNEHTVKSYEEELQFLKDSLIKMGSLTESQLSDAMDAVIKVDKDSIGLDGMSTTNATIPINISGAVSPNACANPIIVPDKVPGSANGTTCLLYTSPSPRDRG